MFGRSLPLISIGASTITAGLHGPAVFLIVVAGLLLAVVLGDRSLCRLGGTPAADRAPNGYRVFPISLAGKSDTDGYLCPFATGSRAPHMIE